MRKRGFQCMALLGLAVGVLSGCEYNDLTKVGLDEAFPKVVAPVIYDTLTLDEMVRRHDELSSLYYDDEGIAYLYHGDTMRLGKTHLALSWNRTPTSSLLDWSTTLPLSVKEQTFDVAFELFQHANLSAAVITSQAFDVVIDVLEAPEGFTSVTGTIKLADLPQLKEFTAKPGEKARVPMGQVVHDNKFKLMQALRDQLRVTLGELSVEPKTLTGTLRLEVHVAARGVNVKRAWGRSALGYSVSQPSQVTVKADAFATTVLADQSLPGVEVGVEVYKPEGMLLEFGIEALRAYNSKNPSFPAAGMLIENSQVPVAEGALNVMKGTDKNQWNVVDPAKTHQQFKLNAANSNIEAPFSKGANRLSFTRIEVREPLKPESATNPDEELPIGERKVELIKWVKIPMDGWVKSNLMRSQMAVDPGFFEATSKMLEGSDQGGVKLEDIFFCFYAYNAIPMDMYARFIFMDKQNNEIMSLNFHESGNPQKEGLGLMGKGASVSGRFTDKPAESYHELKISREDYDKMAASAVKVVTEYLFTSTDIESGTRVALRKQDYVRLNMALRVSGKVSVLKKDSK